MAIRNGQICLSQILNLKSNSARRNLFCILKRRIISHRPSLEHFIANHTSVSQNVQTTGATTVALPSYISKSTLDGQNRKVYFDVHGCQMNVNDVEISWSVLKNSGYTRTTELGQADVILMMTCSIRDGAEQKIWRKLNILKQYKKKRQRNSENLPPLKIGILGRLYGRKVKVKILEQEKMVDLVCGPDAYKDLPRMLAVTESGQTAVNVLLSLDETYADVMPVRLNENSPSAFVSIMRGCDNMCSYCIVPFTRGRERSRPISSILDEVRMLSDQNVNSYRDTSDSTIHNSIDTKLTPGFKTVYKPKTGGRRFSDLLDKVSQIDPEMRIRFTSPHPKDFPDEVLDLIKERSNICNQIHLPAQSGNSEVLQRMRRGYTREAYLDLVYHIDIGYIIRIDVYLSSDFIAGFCEETELEHEDTVSLMKEVKYHVVYSFPYSMRQKTSAYHRLKDNVPDDVKSRRHLQLRDLFRQEALKLNLKEIGSTQLILIEGESKRSPLDMAGRNDGNVKVIVPNTNIPESCADTSTRNIQRGDYVVVKIRSANSQVLHGIPLYHTSLTEFYNKDNLITEQLCQSSAL
ncbi:CDK5 regulatory subunit-associated protein 1,CDK5RAP1-like protein,tRNA-2-methylthio-N(6)-dimethylallyladenosine synthase [Mytilus edulis]|uniref:CDK5 regulatory subunit-associated protein 1,CDK5RAP1-like protein,tRNA-2-methylthio-N(6)-dimethylallyladenosine synthase n=1 Tax=Mytilus edulis TaxID=6550 RepID=A0A8S3VBQ2_MYTED|nr:CDK5 regulatory subunit-associated protein 1,CDK5RAP1-like protein,tRNA-2-methylthio-N(6)-dimethylallyladenosine synthase [Mytilus edulis]